jgi:hypothetical protein
LRAVLVISLIVTPALMLPGATADGTQVLVLIAFFAGLLSFIEYASQWPGLVAFRHAPPFNRLRFLTLALCVLLATLVVRAETQPSAPTLGLATIAQVAGMVFDGNLGPVRQVTQLLPAGFSPEEVARLRDLAGLSLLLCVLMLGIFGACLFWTSWPARDGAFNIWINLPTFNPTATDDIAQRLVRHGRLNVAAGLVLPFALPMTLRLFGSDIGEVALDKPQSMIWTVALWSVLPTSLAMRGLALLRVASLLERERQGVAPSEQPALPRVSFSPPVRH